MQPRDNCAESSYVHYVTNKSVYVTSPDGLGGKSAIALQEAITFARSGAPGDYFNLEMTAEARYPGSVPVPEGRKIS